MYNEVEFWYPYFRLKEADMDVTVVAPEAGKTYTSKIGMPATSDAAAAEIDAAQYDGLVIPGGYAPDIMRRNAEMVNLVKTLDAQGKLVAAICHAGWMLASADIVRGRQLTSYFSIRDDLVHAGAKWVDEEVVVDANLVTSRTPADLPIFMRKVIAGLA
jgi:protease I